MDEFIVIVCFVSWTGLAVLIGMALRGPSKVTHSHELRVTMPVDPADAWKLGRAVEDEE